MLWEESGAINEAEKALTSGKTSLKYYNAQIGEMIVNVKTTNKNYSSRDTSLKRLAIDDVALSPGRFYQHHHFATQPFMLARLMRNLCEFVFIQSRDIHNGLLVDPIKQHLARHLLECFLTAFFLT